MGVSVFRRYIVVVGFDGYIDELEEAPGYIGEVEEAPGVLRCGCECLDS
jgi:hypothetical protein